MNNKLTLPVEPVNDVFYRNCGYHCLITALHYFRRKYQLFIANAASIIEISGNKYVEQRHPDDLLRDMAVKAEGHFESADICTDLINCISRGQPAILHVDCFYLPGKKEFYQKGHWGHSILVCGYDQQTFHIVDNETIFSTRYEKSQLTCDELKTAYAGYLHHFNPQRNHICFTTVAEEGSPINYTDEDIRNIAITHLKAIKHDNIPHLTHAHFTSSLVSDIIIAKKIELYKFTTIINREKLADILRSMIADYEHLRNVVTKMELRQTYNSAPVQEKLHHLIRLEEMYNEMIFTL